MERPTDSWIDSRAAGVRYESISSLVTVTRERGQRMNPLGHAVIWAGEMDILLLVRLTGTPSVVVAS